MSKSVGKEKNDLFDKFCDQSSPKIVYDQDVNSSVLRLRNVKTVCTTPASTKSTNTGDTPSTTTKIDLTRTKCDSTAGYSTETERSLCSAVQFSISQGSCPEPVAATTRSSIDCPSIVSMESKSSVSEKLESIPILTFKTVDRTEYSPIDYPSSEEKKKVVVVHQYSLSNLKPRHMSVTNVTPQKSVDNAVPSTTPSRHAFVMSTVEILSTLDDMQSTSTVAGKFAKQTQAKDPSLLAPHAVSTCRMHRSEQQLELIDAKVPSDELAMHKFGYLTKSCHRLTEAESRNNRIIAEPAFQRNEVKIAVSAVNRSDQPSSSTGDVCESKHDKQRDKKSKKLEKSMNDTAEPTSEAKNRPKKRRVNKEQPNEKSSPQKLIVRVSGTVVLRTSTSKSLKRRLFRWLHRTDSV